MSSCWVPYHLPGRLRSAAGQCAEQPFASLSLGCQHPGRQRSSIDPDNFVQAQPADMNHRYETGRRLNPGDSVLAAWNPVIVPPHATDNESRMTRNAQL
jgi:hypothetical protein